MIFLTHPNIQNKDDKKSVQRTVFYTFQLFILLPFPFLTKNEKKWGICTCFIFFGYSIVTFQFRLNQRSCNSQILYILNWWMVMPIFIELGVIYHAFLFCSCLWDKEMYNLFSCKCMLVCVHNIQIKILMTIYK